jgi:fermentation-respiration switch protein FrsA (DUF1100 family)
MNKFDISTLNYPNIYVNFNYTPEFRAWMEEHVGEHVSTTALHGYYYSNNTVQHGPPMKTGWSDDGVTAFAWQIIITIPNDDAAIAFKLKWL